MDGMEIGGFAVVEGAAIALIGVLMGWLMGRSSRFSEEE